MKSLSLPVIGEIADGRRAVLILIAFLFGGAVPIQLVTLSFGYAQYIEQVSLGPRVIMTAHEFAKWYIPLVYMPAIAALFAIAIYCKQHYPDISRRIMVGFGMGAVCTLGLDAVRQIGVIHAWLPGDTPVMFGKMATGSGNFAIYFTVGMLVHFFNGANFGLFYAFVWGKQRNYKVAVFWATAWAILVEIGMMTGPPMGPMVGMFGVNFAWPQLFLLTFAAHIVFGVGLGLLVQSLLTDEDRGGLFAFIRGTNVQLEK